jgi:hypothetical protein
MGVHKPLAGQLMDVLQGALTGAGEEAALVAGLEVVRDVQECCAFEGLTEGSYLSICRDEASEPVIGDAHRGDDLPGAAEL